MAKPVSDLVDEAVRLPVLGLILEVKLPDLVDEEVRLPVLGQILEVEER